jgi:hypothetical protein
MQYLQKITWLEGNGKGTKPAYSVTRLKIWSTYFFQCSFIKCVCGIVGTCLGETNIPGSIEQYREWIQKLLPKGKSVHQLGSRLFARPHGNLETRLFWKKLIKHPAEIVVHACAFMSYWAGLFTSDFAWSMVKVWRCFCRLRIGSLLSRRGLLESSCWRHHKRTRWAMTSEDHTECAPSLDISYLLDDGRLL